MMLILLLLDHSVRLYQHHLHRHRLQLLMDHQFLQDFLVMDLLVEYFLLLLHCLDGFRRRQNHQPSLVLDQHRLYHLYHLQ